MLEATFFGVRLLGRERVSPPLYFFACRMVTFSTPIVANNSWIRCCLAARLAMAGLV